MACHVDSPLAAIQNPHRNGIRFLVVGFLLTREPHQPDGPCHRTDDACIEQSVAQHPREHHHDELRLTLAHLHLWHHGHLYA